MIRETCCPRRGKLLQTTIVKKSVIDGAGLGLFAARNIKQGEEIAEFSGEVIGRQEALRLDSLGYGTHIVTLLHGFRYLNCKETTPESCKTNASASFANSCRGLPVRANAHLRLCDIVGKERAWLRAKRDIEKGEEIFFNYAY